MKYVSITTFRPDWFTPKDLSDHKIRRRAMAHATRDRWPWHVWVEHDGMWIMSVYGGETKEEAETVARQMRNTPGVWSTGEAVKMQVREGSFEDNRRGGFR